ncbi:hypothetical protein Rumeso_00667 [Rubellimicrobium mesophilum DSM 19309]|uniref:Uncharacterized protein n=2 Tax=Rubellimicrobium TaxID=295418 RepID=A0A017HVC8_9RHOB|nr:hypothetical protein Rumeso_00667 [Rubellimicrobium mesophilum DSM 19309]
MDRLRRARGAFQSELVRHAAARTRDTDRLAHLRTLADTGAKQADALIGTMRDRQAAREQIKEAEDLRLFFRLAVGYTAALLNAGPS